MNIPNNVKEKMQALLDAGYEAYIIGGAVRDSFLKKEPHDYDIFTNANGNEILKLFPKGIILGGEERQEKILTIIVDDIEISQYRKNGDRTETGNNLEDHLSTCDFTVNAIACDINGKIIDPNSGIYDINNRILKFVGVPEDRMKEDPLRILRAFRFWATFTKFVDYTKLINNLDLLDTIPKERIREEFMKILETNIIEVLAADKKILSKIIPELESCYDMDGGKYHGETVLEHMIKAFNFSRTITDNILLRLTIFLHDIGKGITGCYEKDGEWHFYEHEKHGAIQIKRLMKRLKFSVKEIKYVTTLIELHMYSYKGNPGKKSHLRFFAKLKEANITIEDYVMLLYCDHQGNAKKPRIKFGDFVKGNRLIHKYYEYTYSKEPFTIKDLEISGHDVMKYGVKGKDIGDVLKRIFEEVQEGIITNERHILMFKLKEWLE